MAIEVFAVYSNGDSIEVTSKASCDVKNTSLISAQDCLLTAMDAGTTAVTVEYGGFTAVYTLVVEIEESSDKDLPPVEEEPIEEGPQKALELSFFNDRAWAVPHIYWQGMNEPWPGVALESSTSDWFIFTANLPQDTTEITLSDSGKNATTRAVNSTELCFYSQGVISSNNCQTHGPIPRVTFSHNPGYVAPDIENISFGFTADVDEARYSVGGDEAKSGTLYSANTPITLSLGDGIETSQKKMSVWYKKGDYENTESFLYFTDVKDKTCFPEPDTSDSTNRLTEQKKEQFQALSIYQINTESFIDGDKTTGFEWGYGQSHHDGDIPGIIQSLDYIKSLGVNAIWLTPIFDSEGDDWMDTTGYFTRNYFAIDPHFGTLGQAREMVNKAHDLGMYVFFDGVFGHHKGNATPSPCGNTVDGGTGGVTYPDAFDFFAEVAVYWIHQLGIDGWRLDQAYQVPVEQWTKIRHRVEAVSNKRKAQGHQWGTLGYMVAEVWSVQDRITETIYGNQDIPGLYSAFDFPARYMLTQVLATQEDVDPDEEDADPPMYQPASWLEEKMQKIENVYPSSAIPNFMLTNHDLVRFGDLIERADYPGIEDKSYWDRHRAAFSYMSAFTGPITFFYGDEIGQQLDGFDDAEDRGICSPLGLCDDSVSRISARIEGIDGVVLNKNESDLKEYLTTLLDLRKRHPALSQGERQPLYTDDNVYAVLKITENEKLLYVLNVKNEVHHFTLNNLPQNYKALKNIESAEVIQIQNNTVEMTVPALSGHFYSLY